MKGTLLTLLIAGFILIPPVSAQAGQQDEGIYSWVILVGLLVMLLLLGIIIQLRRTRPKTKEKPEEAASTD
jgi:hypothetical protein